MLPDSVANQIAAGEVVERPASVVKELVENALDAGARQIDVRIERGGKRRIRVADDGYGMSRPDALLALDRHATSKIERAEDLRGVTSFGFRGEALPSIAAVARLVIETREADDPEGTRVRATGGSILDVQDVARQVGTTIDVQNLFFNAPARARFLKAVGVESRAVSETLTTLALAHPERSIRLESDDRTLLDLPPSDTLVDRIARIWGDEAAAGLLAVTFEAAGVRVEGLVQRPDLARPGARRTQLFLGARPFRDPALLRAAERGYRTTLPEGVRPWLFLRVEVPAGAADVNVHPAKAEVRFRDRAGVERVIEDAVRSALAGVQSAATVDAPSRPGPLSVREPQPPPAERDSQMAFFVAGASRSEAGSAPGEQDAEAVDVPQERPRLYQLHRTWILAESREGLLIIDQHSAHERVLFERLMHAYGVGGEEAQRLLFPLTLKLTPDELAQVADVRALLARAGFEVEPFGSDTVIVHAVPNPHPWFDAERCFREMVAELTEGTSDLMRSARNQHERIAMTFACKGAIKAGQVLGEREMQELFEALFATELPWHDVHGRPTVVRLSRVELERKFGRV